MGPVRVGITRVFATVTIDLDNLAKPVLDAFKGIVLHDDEQVRELTMRKHELDQIDRIQTFRPLLLQALDRGEELPSCCRRGGIGLGGCRVMQTSTLVAEARRIQELAREYQERGHEVAVEPKSEQLPSSLADFRPDLLVRRGDDVVVVEVKSRGSLGDPKLQQLAIAVREQPRWRFEVVLLKPESEFPGARPWSAEEIEDRLTDAPAPCCT